MKLAKITPLYKGGSRLQAKNYRPIALTSNIAKVMEKVIKSGLVTYLENHDLKARVIDANLSKKVLVRLQQTP